jgi:glutamine synthetase
MSDLKTWIESHRIGEVECLVPDMNGVLRGKVVPAAKLIQSARDGSLRLPSSIFALTVTGDYADAEDEDAHQDPDMSSPTHSTRTARRGASRRARC